ncbi:MAG: DUF4154 domain-containing protein [Candidatus Zixiibacteriota bacterium]|nr:MAG: DUF4154 domain-containing protein [candidate division Zixibacteria bacterium]
MKSPFKTIALVVIGPVLFLPALPCRAADPPPPGLAAALIVKLAAFERNLASEEGDISICVIGAPLLAEKLERAIGYRIGSGQLKKVLQVDSIPEEVPTIVCLGDSTKLSEVKAYTRDNKILSVTTVPGLVAEGISLGIGIGGNRKPEVTLNLTSSREEDLDWNPAIFKIVQIVE